MLLVDDVDDREYLVKLFEAILDRALALMRNEMEHSE